MLLEYFRPVVEEILVECRILRMVRLKHSPIEPSNFFGLRGEVDEFVYQMR